MSHILLEKAFVFLERNRDLSPKGCTYDRHRGVWMTEDEQGGEILVRSNNRPRPGSKKNDIETGEDQKGF